MRTMLGDRTPGCGEFLLVLAALLLPKDVSMAQHAAGPIRLVHLATHASGLPRMPSNLSPADVRDPYADYEAKDLYAFLSSHSLASTRRATRSGNIELSMHP